MLCQSQQRPSLSVLQNERQTVNFVSKLLVKNVWIHHLKQTSVINAPLLSTKLIQNKAWNTVTVADNHYMTLGHMLLVKYHDHVSTTISYSLMDTLSTSVVTLSSSIYWYIYICASRLLLDRFSINQIFPMQFCGITKANNLFYCTA